MMVSGEELVERGRLEKKRKPKSGEGKPVEFWSQNFLGRIYKSAVMGASESRSASTQRLHWQVDAMDLALAFHPVRNVERGDATLFELLAFCALARYELHRRPAFGQGFGIYGLGAIEDFFGSDLGAS